MSSFGYFSFKYLAALLVCGICISVTADESKRALDHADYDRWNTIRTQRISNDGKWVMYSTESGAEEPTRTLFIQRNGKPKQYKVTRGSQFRFSDDSKFALYRISPDPKVIKKLRKEKAKPDQMPQAQMELLNLETGEHFTVPRVQSFAMPERNSDWLAYILEKPFESKTVKEQKSDVSESYEVTPEGLKRPEKPLKLKKRRAENSETEESEKESAKEKKGKAKSESKSKSESKNDDDDDEEAEPKEKAAGNVLVLRNLKTGVERRFPEVVRMSFSKFGNTFAFATSLKQDEDAAKKPAGDKKANDKKADDKKTESPEDGIHVVDLKTVAVSQVASGLGNYKNLVFNEDGTHLAFITDKDDYKTKTSTWSLYHWSKGSKEAREIAKEGSKGIPKDWWVSPNSTSFFSEDGRRLFFDTAPLPEKVVEERANKGKEKDKDEEDKKPKLDLWHWQDPLLQPQQLLQAEQEKRRSYVAVYDLKSKKIIQLSDKEFPSVSIDPRSTADIAVGVTVIPYQKMMSWDWPPFQDSFLVNLKTGERNAILKKSKSGARLSPGGKFVTWFDSESGKWFAASTGKDQSPKEISKGIPHTLFDELHDTPSLPRPYGAAGWTEDDGAFLIYDRFDIWQLDPAGEKEPVCITKGMGRADSIRYRYIELDDEARFVDLKKPLILTAFSEKTKASGFYRLQPESDEESDAEKDKKSTKDAESDNGPKTSSEQSDEKSSEEPEEDSQESPLQPLMMLDESLRLAGIARDTDDVIMTRSTFQRTPDLWGTTTDFKKIHRLSDINPQQDEYLWGSAELVQWTATDGQELDGLLYKPDNFDPSKKYPLMVYFYERNSDNLHRYYAPAPGRSIINFSFYASRGYVIFVPDIPYTTGEPGPSASNAVLSGTQSIVDMGFIDEKRIGTQGHSWGGYQTAYLITQTDVFACAESGAPVSNMTSAYGGIRWGSGMSRMFQYERTQSRIGDTLWNAREKYIANSPLFFADKVNTPVLILHNDQDGAVPWYQGIEFFVALRRLEKPAWLLNYNGDPHWVMGQVHRRDFATRMQQFFDHYLLNAPEPEWMAYGIPAVDKGEKLGLDLLEPKKEKAETEEAESKEPEAEGAE